MNYHLHRNGQTVGVFSVEELRRRREAGELSGNDLVWREGMPTWQTLDSILQSGTPTPTGIPPSIQSPRPASSGKRVLIWGLSIAAVIIIAGVVIVGVVVVKYARRFQPVANQNTGNASVELASKE